MPSSENPMNLSGSRAHRKPVAELIREWLEDQADGREAERRWKALKSGKTEAIPADDWQRPAVAPIGAGVQQLMHQ